MFRRFVALLVGLVIISAFLSACGDGSSISPVNSPAPLPVTNSVTNPVKPSMSGAISPTGATSLLPSSTVAPDFTTTSANTVGVTSAFGPSPTATKLSGKIVYSLAAPENAIYVINPDNSQRLKLANGSGPVFSPASKRIAYREITSDSGSDELVVAIKSISLDGSNKQIYCLLGAGTGMLIRWSPDSRYIASARWQTGVMAT